MKIKKGAAAFYIVAFSTLILVVVATSFAMVVMSEMTRTMNDDLAQSAYDSALAGVEDAKVAFANYRRCAEAGTAVPASEPAAMGCSKIMWIMANPDCDMVNKMLYGGTGEVTLGSVTTATGDTENITNQAYTCVKILTELSDYRSSLGTRTGKYVQTIRAGVADGGTNTVDRIKFSWYSVRGTNPVAWNNVNGSGNASFPSVDSIAVPPTIEMQIVQTTENFTLEQFDETGTNQTNRATLFLVPKSGNSANSIAASEVVKTNDRYSSNHPFMIDCNDSGEFYCSVEISLPEAIGGSATARRANDTFLISVSIPYKDPDTDFALELICDDAGGCGGTKGDTISGGTASIVKLKNTQIAIDSTGRANDLVRRVETRLESSDTNFGMGTETPYYALQILGNSGVNKDMAVTKEHNFYF